MNKISSGVVFVCIFALTHHSAITASASDLSPLSKMAVQEAANSAATTTMSAGAGATDLFAIESEAASRGDDATALVGPREGNRRQKRSPFYFLGLDSNLYGNYVGYYNPYYSYYPTFYKTLGVYNPYYGGYPARVILG